MGSRSKLLALGLAVVAVLAFALPAGALGLGASSGAASTPVDGPSMALDASGDSGDSDGGPVADGGGDDANQSGESDHNRDGPAAGSTEISVSATGEVTGEPDQAVVSISASVVAADPSAATERLAANASRMRTALEDAGVPADAIRTTDFRVFEVHEPPGDRIARTNASDTPRYRAIQAYEITLDNTSRAGEIVDVALSNGGDSVNGVAFELADDTRRELRSTAIDRAMASARHRATAAAEAENLSVRGVASISVADGADGPRPPFESAAADTRVDPQPVTVAAQVQVVYNASAE